MRDALKSLADKQAEIITAVHSLDHKFATKEATNEISDRLDKLEDDKAKVIGAFVVLQAIGTAVLFAIFKVVEFFHQK